MVPPFQSTFRPFRRKLEPHFHISPPAHDKSFVSRFLQHAEEIFATAREGGQENCDLSILVNREGAIHMVAGSTWGLEPLRTHYGAAAVYCVRRAAGRVTVQAGNGSETCFLTAAPPAEILTSPLGGFPQYQRLP